MASKINFGEDEPIADINIVPFVDIVLVILIIFMVTAPIAMSGFNVDLFKASSSEKIEPTKISISIAEDGAVYLNGQQSSHDQIRAFAADLTEEKINTQAIISADKNVAHGQVVAVIDAVKSAGVKGLAISVGGK